MRRVAIVTDSSSDLAPDAGEAFGIAVAPLSAQVGDERLRDRVDLAPPAFIERMRAAESLPTVVAPSVETLEQIFRSLLEEHATVCCVLGSGRLVETVDRARDAASRLPDPSSVHVIDTGLVSWPLQRLAMRAAVQARAGSLVEEIAAMVLSEASTWHTLLFAESMEHLHRGGEIGKAAQLLGTAIDLRPLVRLDGGQFVPFERTRTRARAILTLIAFAEEVGAIKEAAVLYTSTPDDARDVADQIADEFKISVTTVEAGPLVAVYAGPGALGIALKEAPL